MAVLAPARLAETTTGTPGEGLRRGSTITAGIPRSASHVRCVAVGDVRTSSTPALSRALIRSSQAGGGWPFLVRSTTAETTRSTPSRQAASSTPPRIASAYTESRPCSMTSTRLPRAGLTRCLG